MARITIGAYGSMGDLLPLTDVGTRLMQAGHDVVMTTTPELAADIAARGIDVRTVDFELDREFDLETENPLKAAREMVLPKGMRKLGTNLLAALDDTPTDILLLTPFTEIVGHPLAEARDIPSIGLRLQPMSTTSAFAPSLLGGWNGGALLNRTAGRFAASMFDRLYGSTIAGFREQLGLPRRSARVLRRDRTRAEWPILHGFSPSVVARPDDWRPGIDVVGYWWPTRPADWEPPQEIVSFLESGPPPVYFGLGSLMMSKSDAARTSEIVGEALRTLGLRGIVASGGAGLHVVDDAILTVGSVPHDWLFEHVAAVVHSCGAGTTGAALRAGRPSVAVPSPGGDQPFWAKRLRDLGVSPATLPRPKLRADSLADAIDAAIGNFDYRTNAEHLADAIGAEDGAGEVVVAVERLVRA